MRTTKLAMVGAVVGLSLFACGGEPDASEFGAEEHKKPITNGNLVPPDSGDEDAATVFIQFQYGKVCSGLKIGSKRFLTGAHCVGFLSDPLVPPGSWIKVTNNLNSGIGLVTLTVSFLTTHPTSWLPGVPDNISQDFAIIDVEQSSTNIPSLSRYRKARVEPETTGWLTAYGCDAYDPSHGGRKQYAPFYSQYHNPTPGWDDTWIYSEPADDLGTICFGDSGGPLLRNPLKEARRFDRLRAAHARAYGTFA